MSGFIRNDNRTSLRFPQLRKIQSSRQGITAFIVLGRALPPVSGGERGESDNLRIAYSGLVGD